jgi:hypothetical protein
MIEVRFPGIVLCDDIWYDSQKTNEVGRNA